MTVTLTKPGDEVTMLVKSVATVESTAKAGTFRYQIDGQLANGKDERTYLNTPVVDKQLSHLQLAEAVDLIGSWYRFYRVAAPNNTPAAGYLNIEVASKGSAQAAVTPSKRLTEATANAPDTRSAGQREFDAAVPLDDGPPAHHAASGVPASEDGELFDPPTMRAGIAEKRELIESAYRWAYAIAYRAQMDIQDAMIKEHSVAFNPTAESVQAGAATLLIQAERRGAI